jgi:hypothetical protein
LALNHAFGCLGDVERANIDYDLLLPVLIGTAFYSNEGFQSAYFLGGLDMDIQSSQSGKLDWNVSIERHQTRPMANRDRRAPVRSGRSKA